MSDNAEAAGQALICESLSTPLGREFLTFRLQGEEYGIDVLLIQEIRGYERLIREARQSPLIEGFINLRGVLVPVVDFRRISECKELKYDAFTVNMVASVRGRLIAVTVDSVSDVLSIGDLSIEAPSKPALQYFARYVFAHARLKCEIHSDPRAIYLLDLVSILAGYDFLNE